MRKRRKTRGRQGSRAKSDSAGGDVAVGIYVSG